VGVTGSNALKIMSNRNTLLYIALGEYYANQAVLSLISLSVVYGRTQPKFGVMVITDLPKKFEVLADVLSIKVHKMDAAETITMRGSHGFVLRPKIALIKQVQAEVYGNILFIDTDTIVRQKLCGIFKAIEQGFCYLHKKEWPLRKGRLNNPELCPRDLDFTLGSGQRIQIDNNTEMWNSGVVGIPAAKGKLIIDALELCDLYYETFPGWHVEQFSLSIILQRTAKLRGCERHVHHYWHSKPIFTKLTGKFFSLMDSGRHQETLNEGRCLIPRMLFEMQTRSFLAQVKVWFRDLPGVYLVYKLIVKPFRKI
jgi:hypothetical protein